MAPAFSSCTCSLQQSFFIEQRCCGPFLSWLCGLDCTPMTAASVCCCSKKRRRQAGDDDIEGSDDEDTPDEEADGSGSDSDASDLASGAMRLEQTALGPSGCARGQHADHQATATNQISDLSCT